MPNQDRTGPEGQGSRTGRGLGKCNPNNKDLNEGASEEQRQGKGHGQGRGRGQGKGLGRGQGRKQNN